MTRIAATTTDGEGRRAGPRAPLTRGRIVAAAFARVDAEGLSALSARRLGEALGCEAMSIYHHFPSKRVLLDAMVAQELAGIADPPIGLDPVARLAFLGREFRAMALRHPRFFEQVALRSLDTPADAAFTARMLSHFRAAVPDEGLAAQAFRVFRHYATGAALDEAHAAVEGIPAAGSTYALGLDIILDGIAALRAKALMTAAAAPKPVIHPKR